MQSVFTLSRTNPKSDCPRGNSVPQEIVYFPKHVHKIEIVTAMVDRPGWQRVPAEAIHFKRPEEELPIVVCYALIYIALGFPIGLAIRNYPLPLLGATQFTQDFWYSIVYKIVLLLLLPSLLYFGVWGYRWNDLLLGSRTSWKTIVAGAVMVPLGFLLNAGHLQAIRQDYGTVSDPQLRLALGIVMPFLIAALPEELFFRGILQTRL
jgi:hypothetical protein